jgi:hypothetical protein
MKRFLLTPVLVLLLTIVSSGQDFWHVKVSMQGTALMPGDDNGIAYGYGTMITFGYPNGDYDLGFEVQKWWRDYDLFDKKMDSLSNVNLLTPKKKYARNEQGGLAFAALFRYKLLNVMSDFILYSGAGGGFYFIQVEHEEARQNVNTGRWEILDVNYYLETKAQALMFLGLDGKLSEKIDLYLESRMTFIPDWAPWDDWWDSFYGPDIVSGNIGLRYKF